MKKKLLSALLVLALTLTLLPVATAAEPATYNAAFQAVASKSEGTLSYGCANAMVVYLNDKDWQTKYDFTYQCAGKPEATTVTADQLRPVEGRTSARWTVPFDDLAIGDCAIKIYDKGHVDAGHLVGSASVELNKVTFQPNGGTLEAVPEFSKEFAPGDVMNGGQKQGDGSFVAYGEDLEFLFNLANLKLTPPEGKEAFLGWTIQQDYGDREPSEEELLTRLDKLGGQGLTLYAQYGQKRVYSATFTVDGKNAMGNTYSKELEQGYAGTPEVVSFAYNNTGTMPLRILAPKLNSAFALTIEGVADSAEAADGGAFYESGRTNITIPGGKSVTFKVCAAQGLAPGSYSTQWWIRPDKAVASFQLSASLTVTPAGVRVTLSGELEKEYGEAWTTQAMLRKLQDQGGVSVSWLYPDGKGSAPEVGELDLILDSLGAFAPAAVREEPYNISVHSGTGAYSVQTGSTATIKVKQATPVPSVENPTVTIMVGHELSDILPGITFSNPHSSAPVSGTLAWENGEQTWEETGTHPGISYTFTPNNGDEVNYQTYTGTATVEVTDKHSAILTPKTPDPVVTYDGNPHAVAFTAEKAHPDLEGEIGAITVQYLKHGAEGPATTEPPKDAGVYTVTAQTAATDTFAVSTGTTTLTIEPRRLVVSFRCVDKEYDGATNATVSLASRSNLLSNDSANLASYTAHFADANVGQRKSVNITGAVLDNPNYTITQNHHTTGNITPKPVQITVHSGIEKFFGQLRQLTDEDFDLAEGQTLNGDGKSALHIALYSPGMDEPAAAGDHAFQVVPQSDTVSNYSVTIGNPEVKLTVKPSTPEPDSAVTAGDVKIGNALSTSVLHGTFHNKYNPNMTVEGDLTWDDGEQTLTGTDGEVKDGLAWTFTASGKDAGNYDTAAGTASVTLREKAVVTVTLGGTQATYDGKPHAVTVTLEGEEGVEPLPRYAVQYKAADSEFRTDPPVEAGTYTVQVDTTETADYAAKTVPGELVIAPAKPNVDKVTAQAVAEGSTLAQVTLSSPTDVDGKPLAGAFTWAEPSDTVVVEGQTYHYVFQPEDSNYSVNGGEVTVPLLDDTRSIHATVYSLPESYVSYALVDLAASGLKPGEVLQFYKKDADGGLTDPVSDPYAVTETTGSAVVELDGADLDAAGGVIYGKLNDRTKFQPTELTYTAEPGDDLQALTVKEGKTLAVTAKDAQSVSVTLTEGDQIAHGKGAAVTGLSAGATSATVTAVYAHPDKVNHPSDSVTVTKTVPVTVTADPDVAQRGGLTALDGGRSLYCFYRADGSLSVLEMEAEDTVWAAAYTADGAFAGVKLLTPAASTVQLPAADGQVKLFWLSGKQAPLSQALAWPAAQP